MVIVIYDYLNISLQEPRYTLLYHMPSRLGCHTFKLINHEWFTYLVVLCNVGHTSVAYVWQNRVLCMPKT